MSAVVLARGFGEKLRALCSERVYFWAYATFLAGYFLFPQAPEHYRYYYLLVFLPLVAGCVKGLGPLIGSGWYRLVFGYIAYMVITALWSEAFSWPEFARVAWYGGLVAVFVLATAVVRGSDPGRFDGMLRALVVLAAIVGLISILTWYSDHPFPFSRLQPVSRMHHEIMAACAYGFFALLALHFVRAGENRALKAGFFVATLVLLATVVLTQSRTALVALVAAATLLASFRGRIVLFAVATIAAVALSLQPELGQGLMRSMPFRTGIWAEAFTQGWQHWLLGAGYLADTSVQVEGRSFVHAHNAYLATFRDGGVIGLCLLLAVVGTAIYAAFRLDRRKGEMFHLALVTYGLLCAVPDVDRLLTRPTEPWLFLWLPLALALADFQRMKNDQVPSSAVI